MRNNFGLGSSLRRNDWSSLIPRSARDLPKAVMTFPTGCDRLLDNRHIQRTGLIELCQATYKWSYCQGKSVEIVYQSGSGMPFSWCAGLCLFNIPSACKIANPSYFRYFVLCTNQPDRSPDAQILPLVLPLTLQITYTTSPRNPVSQKATRDSHTHIPKTPTQAFRQILHGHSDRSFRLLERGIAHLQARDRHPLAPAELQSILETEKQVDTRPASNSSSPDQPYQADGKRQPTVGRSADSRRDAQTRV